MNLKTISASTWTILDRLHGKEGFWNRLLNGVGERTKALAELGACGEPAVIPEIADCLLATETEVKRAASHAVAGLLSIVPPIRLVELDSLIRVVGSHRSYREHSWRRMTPADLERVAVGEHAISILGLASFHNDGHVRETAVRKLSEWNSGSELPFLLIRANDWARPVRTVAEKALRYRLTPGYAGHFIANLHLALRLEFCGRSEHAPLIQSIAALLRLPECRHHLEIGASSGDRATRRACLQMAAELDGPERFSILTAALTDSDGLMRLLACRHLLPDISTNELPKIVEALKRDPFMPVRKEAIQTLAQRAPEVATPLLLDALLDRHTSMRELSRFYLQKSCNFDAAAFYRERMTATNDGKLVGIIQGLGETGVADDIHRIRPFVEFTEARHRKAALYALSRIGPDTLLETFVTALADLHPGVSNEACKALLPRAHRLDPKPISALLQDTEPVHVRRNALKLAFRLSKWTALPILLEVSTGESNVAVQARKFLYSWLYSSTRAYPAPTESQRNVAKAAFARIPRTFELKLRDELSSFLNEEPTR